MGVGGFFRLSDDLILHIVPNHFIATHGYDLHQTAQGRRASGSKASENVSAMLLARLLSSSAYRSKLTTPSNPALPIRAYGAWPRLAACGFDVLFIITGERHLVIEEENELLTRFRELSQRGRASVFTTLDALERLAPNIRKQFDRFKN